MSFRKARVHLTGYSNTDKRFASASPNKKRPDLHQSTYQYHEAFVPKKVPKEIPYTDPIESQLTFYQTNQKHLKSTILQTRPKTTAIEAQLLYSRLTPTYLDNAHTKFSKLAKTNYTDSSYTNKDVEALRQKLSDRYSNRKDLAQIFNQWDEKGKGLICSEDVHKMVNKLGLSIDFNQAEALMDYAANGLNRTMDYLGFKNFLSQEFKTNQKEDIDVNKRQAQQIKIQLKDSSSKLNSQFLKIDKNKSEKITYENFKEVLSNINLSSHNPKSIQNVYEELGGAADGISYKSALQKLENMEIVDVGKEIPIKTQYVPYQKVTSKSPVLIDRQKAPLNQLDQMVERAKNIRNLLRNTFKNPQILNTELQEIGPKMKLNQLNDFVMSVLESQNSVSVSENDLNSFLSSFIYNKDREVSTNEVVNNIFLNDKLFSNEIQRRYRSQPPTRETNPYSEDDGYRVKKILCDLDNKLYQQGPNNALKIFKSFDKDGDGYITIEDLKDGLRHNKIIHDQEEANVLMSFLDRDRNGFLNFAEFSKILQPNIIASNPERFSEPKEKYLNSHQPSKEYLVLQKNNLEANSKAHQIFRDSFVPDKNLHAKTRYGASPPHKNTFANMVPDSSSGLFLGESDRLYSKRINPMTVSNDDKFVQKSRQEARIEYIRQTRENIFNRNTEAEERAHMKETMNNLKKSTAKQEYERRVLPNLNF